MKTKENKSENARICAAALRLASKGWDRATLDAVAKAANIASSKLKQKCASSAALAALIVDETGREALSAAGKPTRNAHDTLFDLFMARFDVLQKNRQATLNIADAAKRDPLLARALARATLRSLDAFADHSKIETRHHYAFVFGLSAVYAYAFAAWRKDTTRDMSKTMAALDRALRFAGKTARLLNQNP